MSHIATALSACVRMDDQVAAGQPSTASTPASPTSTPGDEWDATGSALAVSDLVDSAALAGSEGDTYDVRGEFSAFRSTASISVVCLCMPVCMRVCCDYLN